MRSARKIVGQGGTKLSMGRLNFFGLGAAGFDGEGPPLHGIVSPPSPLASCYAQNPVKSFGGLYVVV